MGILSVGFIVIVTILMFWAAHEYTKIEKARADNRAVARRNTPTVSSFGQYDVIVGMVKPIYDANGHSYHNWNHIEDTLIWLIANNYPTECVLAWLFHDCVYAPGAETGVNEIDSRRLMVAILRGLPTLFTKHTIEQAGLAILATIDHIPTNSVLDIVLDVDLEPMSCKSFNQFLIMTDNIRQEYRTLVPDDAMFIQHRVSFLRDLLKRDVLFSYHPDRVQLEQSARLNITEYLAMVDCG